MVGVGDGSAAALGHCRYFEGFIKVLNVLAFFAFFFPFLLSFLSSFFFLFLPFPSPPKINPRSLWVPGAGLVCFVALSLLW